ncbi:hypothetical protein [Streptomyces sp. NPDC049915]|uniref:hypothetical protein n=1 Tax=Streptomyces sp. NPDC049915 TaxID=3155510 RepID=UPI00342A3AD7
MNRRAPLITAALATTAALALGACGSKGDDAAKPVSAQQVKTALSAELHAAIKAATPKAVHPKDEFGTATAGSGCSGTRLTVRIAGWDPDEAQSNEELLTKSTAYLEKRGWKIHPLPTDSEDQAARIDKAGYAEGLLDASNQSLTFAGNTACLGT